MIYDIDGRPFGLYANVTFAQELPVAVRRIRTCFYKCHLNASIAVLVLGNVGGCAADGIVPLLVHQSGFKTAHQPNMQLHVIARVGPLRNGKLAVIDGNLKGQAFVPFRRDGNHVAALQRRGLAVALLRKFQCTVSNAIFSTRGWRKTRGFPIRSVDGNLRDGIRIFRIPECKLPQAIEGIRLHGNVLRIDFLIAFLRLFFKGCCHRHIGCRHLERRIGDGNRLSVAVRCRKRLQHISFRRICRNSHRFSFFRRGFVHAYRSVLRCHRRNLVGFLCLIGCNRCGVLGFVQGQLQIAIAVGRNNTGCRGVGKCFPNQNLLIRRQHPVVLSPVIEIPGAGHLLVLRAGNLYGRNGVEPALVLCVKSNGKSLADAGLFASGNA